MRKSLLSALIGIHVDEGHIDLSKTMEELGIDDKQPSLTPEEKKATVGDLLKARSGIYHPALGEVAEMKAARPERHSHAPGAFWYYNNWDFNALGTIFRKETGADIFQEFDRLVAKPLQMQDFQVGDCRYKPGPDSIHPYYSFRMSARDLARFGLLFLRQGKWRNQQTIPADWVQESTATHSETASESGYGYMWWTGAGGGLLPNVEVKEHSFYASGYRGHRVIVLPYRKLVIVHRVDTDAGKTDIGGREIGPLLWLILDAAGETEIGAPPLLDAAKGVQVTASNWQEIWDESTLWHLDGPKEQYIISYGPDGTMTCTEKASGEIVDTGRWWTEGDKVCRQWKALEGGEKICFYLVLDKETLQAFALDGILVKRTGFSRD